MTLVGRRRDLLRSNDCGYLIVRRMILLPQSILATKNLSVFFQWVAWTAIAPL